MKFLFGLITGVLLTLLVVFIMNAGNEREDTLQGLTIFPEKGDCITKQELEIFQVVVPNMALANFGEFPDQTLVLLLNHEGKSYYDKQKIKVPANKCARQYGTYQYTTKLEYTKTVPVVVIE